MRGRGFGKPLLRTAVCVDLAQKSCAHEYNYVVRLPTKPVTIHVHSLFGSHFARCIVKVHLFLGRFTITPCVPGSLSSPHTRAWEKQQSQEPMSTTELIIIGSGSWLSLLIVTETSNAHYFSIYTNQLKVYGVTLDHKFLNHVDGFQVKQLRLELHVHDRTSDHVFVMSDIT